MIPLVLRIDTDELQYTRFFNVRPWHARQYTNRDCFPALSLLRFSGTFRSIELYPGSRPGSGRTRGHGPEMRNGPDRRSGIATDHRVTTSLQRYPVKSTRETPACCIRFSKVRWTATWAESRVVVNPSSRIPLSSTILQRQTLLSSYSTDRLMSRPRTVIVQTRFADKWSTEGILTLPEYWGNSRRKRAL